MKPDINKRYQNLSSIVWTLCPRPMPPMFRPSTSTIVDTVSTWELLEDITSWLIMQDRRCLLLLTVEEERWMKSLTRTHYEPLSIISSLTQYHCSLQHIRSRIKDVTMSKHILPCSLFNAVLNVLSLNNLGIIYYIHVTWVLWWLQQGTAETVPVCLSRFFLPPLFFNKTVCWHSHGSASLIRSCWL